jgi:hypothetical protein
VFSNEMKLYERAIELSKKYPFFSKWEFIIPIIKKNEKTLTLILYLAESYARGRMYSLKIECDLVQNEVISEGEGFNYRLKSNS